MFVFPQFLIQIPSNDQGLRDIKPPLDVPVNILPYVLIGGLILLIIIATIYVYFRKRPQKVVPPPTREVIPRLPHEIALEQLAQLEAESYDMETYHILISNILREYIAARYHIPALELTTTGLLRQMTREQLNDSYVKHVKQFLANCDRVKFATYQAEQSEVDARMVDARWFVEETKAN
ncbi:MAG: hypothetical protein OXD54_16110 [Candidatus Poribacteria bacterium]|nr:hypothetical protein [Candidatus Poribacteria bacterium]